jgi:DNA helicase HerA-like ATPase
MKFGNVGIVVDEVGEYVPEGSSSRKTYSREMERVIRIGRNYGIKPYILITQRPQQVAKKVLDLAQYTIVFKLIRYRSREKVKQLLGMSDYEFTTVSNMLKELQVGQSLVIDDNLNWLVVDWRDNAHGNNHEGVKL